MEDALNATRAAVEEGIVAGGGTALIEAMKAVEKEQKKNSRRKTGMQIVAKALQEPLKQIATNAGLEGAVIVENVKKSSTNEGFDALNEKYVDMIAAGIIDPTKVTRSALQNAASIAAILLTTESAVVEIKKDEPQMPMGGGMPGIMQSKIKLKIKPKLFRFYFLQFFINFAKIYMPILRLIRYNILNTQFLQIIINVIIDYKISN